MGLFILLIHYAGSRRPIQRISGDDGSTFFFLYLPIEPKVQLNNIMALINVIKCEVNNRELIYKFPSDDLCLGSQLIVYSGQTAFFVKGGRLLDQFENGTYTLKSENLPLLDRLINLPFGNKSPFKAEVWFVNQLSILDVKWGTPTPIQLEDPKYNIIIPIRSYGQYGLRVENSRLFLETLVGNMTTFTVDKITDYFRGKVLSIFTNYISNKVVHDAISILEINSCLMDISYSVEQLVDSEFSKYGLKLEDFAVISINTPDDDPSLLKLKEAKNLAARLKITGKDMYQMERSFDVLDKAAANESAGSNMMNMGVGLGAGLNIGNQVGAMVGQAVNIVPPPFSYVVSYYVVLGGQQYGPLNLQTIIDYIHGRKIDMNTMIWKQGMNGWDKISTLTEFASLFMDCPPPLPTDKK